MINENGNSNNKEGIIEDRDALAESWRSFMGYMIRTAPSTGLATAHIDILIRGKTIVAWKISWEEVPGPESPHLGDADKLWEGFVRHILAMARGNSGYATVNSLVVTHNKKPSVWLCAEVRRVYPMVAIDTMGEEAILRILFPTYTRA